MQQAFYFDGNKPHIILPIAIPSNSSAPYSPTNFPKRSRQPDLAVASKLDAVNSGLAAG